MAAGQIYCKEQRCTWKRCDVLYVVRDITEEKSRELMYQKQLKESMEDAHRANLSKQPFSGV